MRQYRKAWWVVVVHCCIVKFTSFQRDGRRCYENFFACVKRNKMDSELLSVFIKIYWVFPRLPFGIVAYAFTLFLDNLCRNSCIKELILLVWNMVYKRVKVWTLGLGPSRKGIVKFTWNFEKFKPVFLVQWKAPVLYYVCHPKILVK